MAKLSILAGSTSKLLRIFVPNSSVTTGAGLTGLAFGTSGLSGYYIREGANATTQITLATQTLGTWSSGGFIVVDGTNMPGMYEISIPNAAIATGAASVVIYYQGAANMAPVILEVELTAVNNQDGVHFGLSGIPNAAAGASGGLLVSGVNSGTTTFGAITCTGSFTISDGLLISRTTANSSGITSVGLGTGSGAVFTSGSGSTGDGIQMTSASAAGNGLNLSAGSGSGSAIKATGGVSGGAGVTITGGTSGGFGVKITAGNSPGTGPAGTGILVTGGLASNATGGVAGVALSLVGGNGNPTLNGAAAGMTITAGGSTTVSGNDGLIITGTKNGNGMSLVHAGTGFDFNATTTPLIVNSISGVTFPANFGSTSINAMGQIMVDGTSPLTESYPTLGAGFTLAESLYNLVQELGERAITGTTVTILKRDQATQAKSYSLNSASNPTSSTEAS